MLFVMQAYCTHCYSSETIYLLQAIGFKILLVYSSPAVNSLLMGIEHAG